MSRYFRIKSKDLSGVPYKFSGGIYESKEDKGCLYVVDDRGDSLPIPYLYDRTLWYEVEEVKQEVSLSVTPGTVAEVSKVDMVSSPKHYGQGQIECIDYIEDFLTKEEYIGYLRGNIAKYLHRWRYKNGVEDLRKAQVYLGWLLKKMEE